jgi:hypothetical protein
VVDTGVGISAGLRPNFFPPSSRPIIRPPGITAVVAWAWPLPDVWRY